MNIFVLDEHPKTCAQMHLDKHVVKMIIEYAQLLSTAHRLRDGRLVEHKNGTKVKKFYLLGNEKLGLNEDRSKVIIQNQVCYSLSHQNHPCAVWARETDSNYNWLYSLFLETAAEYTHRYGRIHKTWTDIGSFLSRAPRNIPAGDRTEFALAMNDECRVPNDPIASYRNYYLGPKAAFARWTNRSTPDWFKAGTKDFDVSHFERTR